MARQLKLSRKKANRDALISNLVSSLIVNGQIMTTEKRAKAAKPVAEKILAKSQQPTLANQRLIRSSLNTLAADHLLKTLSQKLPKKNGGLVRLVKVVARKGDAADRSSLIITTEVQPKVVKQKATNGKALG